MNPSALVAVKYCVLTMNRAYWATLRRRGTGELLLVSPYEVALSAATPISAAACVSSQTDDT